jgi:hypothetical protein
MLQFDKLSQAPASTKARHFVALAFALTLISTANASYAWGGQIVGSGKVVQDTRPISNIVKLDLSTAARIEIIQGTKESLQISVDDNVLNLIEIKLSGDKLTIRDKESFKSKDAVLTIHLKSLEQLVASGISNAVAKELETKKLTVDVSGASRVRIDMLKTDVLDTTTSGASSAKLTGYAKELRADYSGASAIQAGSLKTERVKSTGSGTARAYVVATDSINGSVTGTALLDASGTAKQFAASFSGSSVVQAQELEADTVQISGSGAGRASVRASKEITGDLSGAARVKTYGNGTTNVTRSGVAKISKAE